MSRSYDLQEHRYDVIVVGAGGAGLRATMGLAATGLPGEYHGSLSRAASRTRCMVMMASSSRSAWI